MATNEVEYVTAWGETKKLTEWARMPVCEVTEDELRRRLAMGIQSEVAISERVLTPAHVDRRQIPVPFEKRKEKEFERPKHQGRGFSNKRHSQYIGVSWRKSGGWYAQIRKNRDEVVPLGSFADEVDAARAYDAAARALGRTRLNFPHLYRNERKGK